MFTVNARNVHQALPKGLELLSRHGFKRDSRSGRVLASPVPVTTAYSRPTERVLFHPERDANPYFHLFESLWMLAGREDVSFLTKFNKRMSEYSDDGRYFHGAYGYRWRRAFGFDQLTSIIFLLKSDPNTRRAVLQIWDAPSDLYSSESVASKDIPCNDLVFFNLRGGSYLDMTVCNRSNDVIWGAYGANAVHFSFLHEYIASSVGVQVGVYYQVSNDYHAYLDTYKKCETLIDLAPDPFRTVTSDPYAAGEVRPYATFEGGVDKWENDLKRFFSRVDRADTSLPGDERSKGYETPFFRYVVVPLYESHIAYRARSYEVAKVYAERCLASDWKRACLEWLNRRQSKYLERKAS